MAQQNKIAVIGLGPMGRAITKIYLNKHYAVTVWNRTESTADAMIALGANKAATLSELLETHDIILLSLTDYEVMYTLLNQHADRLKDKVIVNLSSDTPANTRQAAKWAADHGALFIAGAIMVEPETLGRAEALIFYSGDEVLFKKYKSALELMGNVVYVGQDPGLSQLFSIGLLNIFFTTNVAILQSTALLAQAGIRPTVYQPYINGFINGLPEMLGDVIRDVERGHYNGDMNAMDMMYAAMSHVAQTSRDANMYSEVTDLIEKIMKRTVDLGYGRKGLASVFEVFKAQDDKA